MGAIYDNPLFFEKYDAMSRSQLGLAGAGEWHQLQPLFPALQGVSMLDLGCGYGWHCAYAVSQGAKRVVGIDVSQRMIEEAKVRNSNDRIEYRVCDLMDFEYPAEDFDLVVSNLALHYVEDLTAVYKKIRQTLKPGGVFLMNIEHPTFTAGVNQEWIFDEAGRPLYWPVDDYYVSGERLALFLGEKVKKQHHTLTQILNGLLQAGFVLEAVVEAEPPADMMDLPGMADELRRPMMLLVKARKADRF